jgi:hypothetical protein
MAGQLRFSPTSWVTNGNKLTAAGDDLASASQSFISTCPTRASSEATTSSAASRR